ncbi:MAG: 50S ribosomal protein L31 [Anaerolineales bacterium]|nr:50S ribosomal protein L31 [Anaerolineales bacterium]
MKKGIHPQYYPNAQVVCSCGNTWTTGSTQPMIRTDVCSACHPFFTGEQRIVDTAGQVDRFMKRLDRYGSHQADVVKRQTELQKKQEQRFLKQQLAALDLNSQTAQILNDANIITVGDLIKKVEKDQKGLLALEGFTPKSLEEVQAKLAEARVTYFVEA